MKITSIDRSGYRVAAPRINLDDTRRDVSFHMFLLTHYGERLTVYDFVIYFVQIRVYGFLARLPLKSISAAFAKTLFVSRLKLHRTAHRKRKRLLSCVISFFFIRVLFEMLALRRSNESLFRCKARAHKFIITENTRKRQVFIATFV